MLKTSLSTLELKSQLDVYLAPGIARNQLLEQRQRRVEDVAEPAGAPHANHPFERVWVRSSHKRIQQVGLETLYDPCLVSFSCTLWDLRAVLLQLSLCIGLNRISGLIL